MMEVLTRHPVQIVSANAKAAVNFEHSWGDGVAVLRFFNEVCLLLASLASPYSSHAAQNKLLRSSGL